MGRGRGADQIAGALQGVAGQDGAAYPISRIRLAIGEKIALGLDFFLAGDIIQTIIIPSWESLAILGGIVVIRTIIAFFLNRDIKEFAEKK